MYGAKIMGESPMTDGSTRGAGSVAVEVLARAGVRRFYTVPGESFLEVLDAVEEHPISRWSPPDTSRAPRSWPRPTPS